MANETVLEAARILYVDESCAVVNKRAGEAVEGAGEGMANLPRMLADALGVNAQGASGTGAAAPADSLALPTAAHRLDVPVSGCVVFARTHSALAFLSHAFANAANGGSSPGSAEIVVKHYWAIAELPGGTMPAMPPAPLLPEGGELVHYLGFDKQKNKMVAYKEPGAGRKKAVLRCRLAGAGKNYLFLEIELVTGRHHQIRAQLAALGLHVKGDLKYGARRSEKAGGIRLHARSISFPALSGNGRVSVIAEPPLQDNLWLAFPGGK